MCLSSKSGAPLTLTISDSIREMRDLSYAQRPGNFTSREANR
jgi:hypothetical protein